MDQPAKTPPYWFKRRRYGWGVIPTTRQGWLVLVVFIAVIVWDTLITDGTDQNLRFFIIFGLDLLLLFGIIFLKSPTLHWRWGKKDTDNPDEDF